ncbi:MAG: class I SAM-dependent RNA methyltransferase [Desulfarculaceae bacterium]|nr:class I SAM-dependent RNA methyltransferase [Desulfarculaceae bacterium]MCF8071787.1 class I SAM-dependent RNA methyltransferase [Desulfarculaceae bacterium]MCF8101337.1 class I SAM-dependent RNA methyltransferase [Desulfarculaceae bacterium]MCF8117296.1 class I SAM-dependent RNA methyltransferase [Desulfarculaceae bacterium]
MSSFNLERRIKRQVWAPEHAFFAVCAPGLEPLCARELAVLNAGDIAPEPGGVGFRGKLEIAYAANLWLRTAGRVWLRLKDFRVRRWDDLVRQAAAVPWELYVAPGAALNISVSLSASNLKHSGRVAEVVGKAAADRLKSLGLEPPIPAEPGDEQAQRLQVRGVDRRATISLDTSGAHLHKRGYRPQGGAAPLREDLAAALLMLCDYDGSGPLLDPLCGGGTLVIEAALIARHLPPGGKRSFAFEQWPSLREAAWNHMRRQAGEKALAAPPAPILGRDRNPKVVALAKDNAGRAGVSKGVKFEAADFLGKSAPAGTGLVVMNPPYGKRLGSVRQAETLAGKLGERLRDAYVGWRVGAVLYRPEWAGLLGLADATTLTAPFSGLKVSLLSGKVPSQ